MYDIAIITHPSYYKFLPELNETLEEFSGNQILWLHTQTNSGPQKQLRGTSKNISEHVTISQARNYLLEESKAQWIVFLDCDVSINKTYFSNLEKAINKNYDAIAGGIKARNCSILGVYEALNDIRIYLSGVENAVLPNTLSLNELDIFAKTLSGNKTKYFQGFNQIHKRETLLKLGGFREEFWSAEDREIACRYRKNNLDITFIPEISVEHSYDFSEEDIRKRKRIHGFWYTKLRKLYNDENLVPQMNLKNTIDLILQTINVPEPYNQLPNAEKYCKLASRSYLQGIIEGKMSFFKFSKGWDYGK